MTSSKHRRSRASRRSAEPSLLSSEAESVPARHLRIQSLLFQEVSRLFRGELSDPLLEGVAVTSLELSPDGRNARLGFTVPPELAGTGPAQLVEEAPAAYRDISEVLEDEEELVTPLLRLTPIAVLKG